MNCVMVGKMFDWFPDTNIYCDPIPYDAGLTLGGCRYVWHHVLDNPRVYNNPQNRSPYLGKTYDDDDKNNDYTEADSMYFNSFESTVAKQIHKKNFILALNFP